MTRRVRRSSQESLEELHAKLDHFIALRKKVGAKIKGLSSMIASLKRGLPAGNGSLVSDDSSKTLEKLTMERLTSRAVILFHNNQIKKLRAKIARLSK